MLTLGQTLNWQHRRMKGTLGSPVAQPPPAQSPLNVMSSTRRAGEKPMGAPSKVSDRFCLVSDQFCLVRLQKVTFELTLEDK